MNIEKMKNSLIEMSKDMDLDELVLFLNIIRFNIKIFIWINSF